MLEESIVSAENGIGKAGQSLPLWSAEENNSRFFGFDRSANDCDLLGQHSEAVQVKGVALFGFADEACPFTGGATAGDYAQLLALAADVQFESAGLGFADFGNVQTGGSLEI